MAVGGGYGGPGPGYGQPGYWQYGQALAGRPGALQPGFQAPAYTHARLRATDADRDWVVEYLKGAYTDGRLNKEEYDTRVGHALAAKTYADLDAILADLGLRPTPAMPPSTNSLAIASLACGVGQFLLGPLATIPAIVLGHVARHQIRRTQEGGAGMALAGLLLGWAGVALGVLAVVAILLFLAAVGHSGPQVTPGAG